MNEGTTRCAGIPGSRFNLPNLVRAALAAAFPRSGVVEPVPRVDSTALARPSAAGAAAKLRVAAWRYALRQRGKPYIWGGTGPQGYDSSGLVYAAYRSAGLQLPRTSRGLLHSWRLVRISKRQARRGDLAFYGTGHVELYGWGGLTYGAQDAGTVIGFHLMNSFWHPTMYFRVRA